MKPVSLNNEEVEKVSRAVRIEDRREIVWLTMSVRYTGRWLAA